jgi:hypothetical protein
MITFLFLAILFFALVLASWYIFYRVWTKQRADRLRDARGVLTANDWLPSLQLSALLRARADDFPTGEYLLVNRLIKKSEQAEYALQVLRERLEKMGQEIQSLQETSENRGGNSE